MSKLKGSDGQTLVEFALVLPILLVVIVGVFDGGRVVFTNTTLSQAAREGARLGAVEAANVGLTASDCVDTPALVGASSNPGARVCPPNLSSLKTDISDAVDRMTAAVGPVSAVYISCDPEGSAPSGDWTEASDGNGCDDGSGNSIGTSGDVISVRIEHTWQPITPIIGSIIGPTTLSGSASMTIN
ncbi:MAG: TadE/TadG family type IV pilus assembly protein [Candidatus Limnocylindrales bacterium]